MITIFNNFANTTKPIHCEVDKALEAIRQCTVQNLIDELRNETDDKKRKLLKKRLPCILFSGVFPKRDDKLIQSHSGFCILDIDKVDNPEEVKESFKQYPFVYAIFLSPSGDGVKVLCKIPADIKKHRGYYRGLMNMFPEIDSTSINEGRICFASCDADIHINKNAIEFTEYIEEVKATPSYVVPVRTGLPLLEVPVDMVRNAPHGDKHKILLKAAKLMGGHVAGGLISENEAFNLLDREISNRDVDDIKGARKTIKDGILYGMAEPIEIRERKKQYKSKANTTPVIAEPITQENIHDFISTRENESEYLHKIRTNTLELGLSTGNEKLDEYFRFKRGNLVMINGHDNVGKTICILWLIVNSNILHDWKWILFCAENGEGQTRKNLIQIRFDKAINLMTEEEYEEALQWSYDNFTIIKSHELFTYDDIRTMAETLFETKKYDGMLIDPYNALDVDEGSVLNTHDYHYKVKAKIRQFNKKHDCATYVNCHAVTEALRRTHKDGDYYGFPMPPNKADTEGGGKSANRADDFITIHRYTQHPLDYNITHLHVRKIKETETGGRPTPMEEPVKLKMVKGHFGFYSDHQNPDFTFRPRREDVVSPIKPPTIEPQRNYYEPKENDIFENTESDEVPF